MTEHLAIIREVHPQPAPAPAGIINFPAENGIDPTLPPDVILAEATTMALGVTAVSFLTNFNESVSSMPYSEVRAEKTLDEASEAAKDTQMAAEQTALEDVRDYAINPTIKGPAEATLSGRTQHNSINTPFIAKAHTELYELESKARRGGKMTLADRQRIAVLKSEIKRDQKVNSNPFKRRKSRKRDKLARKSMTQAGYSEERIASVMDTHGKVGSEVKRRDKIEEDETRNEVGRIGKVLLGPDGNKYIVKDVESQPAQGFRVIGYEPKPGGKPHELGKPIFAPGLDPVTGKQLPEELHELYIKVGSTYELVPRDDPYLGGQVRQAGEDGRFYFIDQHGSPIPANPAGIKDDSFSPIDDEVILQRLYTGEEAVKMILEGSGVDLSDWTIRIGDLAAHIDSKQVRILPDSKRDLDEHLVFVPSDEIIDPDYERRYPGDPRNRRPIPSIQTSGLLSPYDASQELDSSGNPTKGLSGHFRRFDIAPENTHDSAGNLYVDGKGRPTPKTSRQIAQENHLKRVGAARVAATLKKPLEGRGKNIPTR